MNRLKRQAAWHWVSGVAFQQGETEPKANWFGYSQSNIHPIGELASAPAGVAPNHKCWFNRRMAGSATVFRGMRRDIAVALGSGRLTLYQLAKALGKRSGDIQKTVRQMHAEGLLGASDPEPVRGTVFWLMEKHAAELEESLKTDQPVGTVANHQTLMLLHAPNRAAMDSVLAKADLTASVSWAARCGSGREMLLAIGPDPDERELSVLESALEDANVAYDTCHVTALMDPVRLRSVASAATNVAHANAPAGELA